MIYSNKIKKFFFKKYRFRSKTGPYQNFSSPVHVQEKARLWSTGPTGSDAGPVHTPSRATTVVNIYY